jgi:hypothetical protein
VTLIPYEGKDDWVEGVLREIKDCLEEDKIPESNEGCDYCAYRKAVGEVEGNQSG